MTLHCWRSASSTSSRVSKAPQNAFGCKRSNDCVAYSWPGNVRELRNVVHSAYILAEMSIEVDDLPGRSTSRQAAESEQAGRRAQSSARTGRHPDCRSERGDSSRPR